MNRRVFLGLSGMSMCTYFSHLHAQNCSAVSPGVAGCIARIAINRVAVSANKQMCPEWCWAASMSMIFNLFGYSIDQRRIVLETYGALVCQGAQSPQIAADLSRSWKDDSDNEFSSNITAAYDYDSRLLAINNAVIVNEINSGRPLLYCNASHAMVLCGVNYRQDGYGNLQVDGLWVIDPWPTSATLHMLSPAESVPMHMGGRMRFLASVQVS